MGLELDFTVKNFGECVMPAGMYQGSKFSQIPTEYMKWAVGFQDFCITLREDLSGELSNRGVKHDPVR